MSHSAHLGETAAALVDGELGHDARERALGHLAGCPDCRGLVDAQRRTKSLLAGLAAPDLPPGLAERLAGLRPPPVELPATTGAFHVAAGTRAADAPPTRRERTRSAVGARPGAGPAAGPGRPRRRGHRLRRATSAGAVLTGLVVGALVAGGSAPRTGAPVDPSGGVYLVDHADSSGRLPLSDPGAGAAVSASFTR